jgi:hypothetical protein
MHTSYSLYILHSLVDSTLWLLGINTLLDHLGREVGVGAPISVDQHWNALDPRVNG